MRADQVQGLMEAYSQVHQPQIITEETIQQVADMWAEACMEIGVNFSDYTLDELTEGFIVDMSNDELSESVLNEVLGMPSAQNLGAGLRQQFGKARRAVGSAVGKVASGVKDVAGAAAQGLTGQTTTSKNPVARAYNAVTRGASAPTRAAASFATGVLTGKGATPPAKSAPAKPQKQGPPVPPRLQQKPKPPGSGGSPIRPVPGNERAPAKPALTAPTKPASTSAQKPSGTKPPTTPAAGTKAAGPESIKPKTPNPLLAGGDIRRMQQASQMRQKGITVTSDQLKAAERTKPSEVKKESIDVFDLVKGHLLDEGYAETEENALVMMANMSEEWRKSILEAHGVEILDEAQEARENPEKHEEEKEKEDEKKYGKVRGEKTPMPPRGDKRREDFEKWYAANVR